MCQETRRICETVMVQKSCYSADKPKHGAKKLLVRQFGWGNNGSAFCWSVRQSKVLLFHNESNLLFAFILVVHVAKCSIYGIFTDIASKHIWCICISWPRLPAFPPRDAKKIIPVSERPHDFTHERLASYHTGAVLVDPTKMLNQPEICWTYQQSAQCAIQGST